MMFVLLFCAFYLITSIECNLPNIKQWNIIKNFNKQFIQCILRLQVLSFSIVCLFWFFLIVKKKFRANTFEGKKQICSTMFSIMLYNQTGKT